MLLRQLSSNNLVTRSFTLGWLRTFYDSRTRLQTIFAPATAIHPNRGSPLSIVRVSGTRTKQVIEKITNLRLAKTNEHKTSEPTSNSQKIIEPRHARLTKIFEPNTNELIDIGLCIWFPGPNSYTGEDVCELHVHGSHAIMNKLLMTLGQIDGLRPADPGEFTRRAVNNGKLSLVQAESLPDLISAKTDQQRRLALSGLTGSTRRKYEFWIETLINVLAHLEASIDFGEDELIGEKQVVHECIKKLQNLAEEISHFVTVSGRCRDFTQTGARVVILGKPNAGKSTFMNLLCRQEKSIVSDLRGTTRDIVEHSFELGGHMITLNDTAGLRGFSRSNKQGVCPNRSVVNQHDSIEREGIKRAIEAAKKSHLVLYLFDGSKLSDMSVIFDELSETLDRLGESDYPRTIHLVINKIDLNDKLQDANILRDLEDLAQTRLNIKKSIDHVQVSTISCKTQKNFNILLERISSSLNRLQSKSYNGTSRQIESDYVNERHLSLLRSTQRHLDMACKLNFSMVDEIAQHVRESVDYLSRIVGSVSNERVIDIIFKDFCIGK